MGARWRARAVTIAVLLGIAGAVLWAVPRLDVETDITHFLPPSGDPRLDGIARRVASSELNRTITLTIEGPDVETAARAARELADRLRDDEGAAWVRNGPDEELQRAFHELYFPRRLAFVTDRPEELEESISEEALRARARELRRQLGLPTSMFVRELAPEDPWLLFIGHLQRIQSGMRGDLRVHEGQFVTEDGRHGVILLATEASPFDTDAQRAFQQRLTEGFEAVSASHDADLRLEQAGVHRIAVRSEQQVRADVTRVSVAGMVGVLAFLLLVFGSARYLLVGHLPLATGVAAGVVASAAVFESIHGLTLAFGATLIGVAIDYVAHALEHHVLAPAEDGPTGTLRRIWPGLLLGGATTVAGVAALAWTGYPAIQEMAVFTSVGVAAALLATRWLMPPWLPPAPRPTRPHRFLARRVEGLWARLSRRRRTLWVLPAAALVVVAAGAFRIDFDDDLRSLGAPEPDLLAEDARVRGRVSRVDAGRFAVAFGDDLEAALRRNDRVHRALEDARADGLLERHRSLHSLLWSERLQRRNREALADADAVFERTARAYEAEGFFADAFAPFRDALDAPPDPLRLEDLRDSPLAPLVAPFVLRLDDGVAILTFVHGVEDEAALASRLSRLEDVAWFDQSSHFEAAYARFRTRTIQLLLVGLVAVLLLVLARYRRVGPALAAVVPAVLAGATSLALVSLAGVPLTLVHVVTLLLVLSMGVDYGVFMVESTRHPEGPTPTIMSLLVACVSTMLSFGALALSDHPALGAMGTTTSIGVVLSLLLAPTATLLLRDRSRQR